ncbi:MAG: YihY/virulence factor BrkB family protein [Oscillibacter sp.]|nr:YihY/virulence factor BrkB family protein [Oscillibacter sp.]
MIWERWPDNRAIRGAGLLVRRYLRHNVGIQSAALAFYLLFMIFPFLIFVSALLGLLQLDVAEILAALEELLPREIVELVGVYLRHVREHSSVRLAMFGLLFSVYFPMRATNALLRSVRTAYHLGPPRRGIGHWLRTLLYTVVLLTAIFLTLTAMTVGERILVWSQVRLRLTALAEVWVWLRFPVAAAVGFFALLFLYALAQDGRRPWRELWPGAAVSLAVWLGLSWLYALYVENFADYSLLYGAIGTVVVLLVWLYLSSIVLIMGAEVNGVLISLRRERAERLN